MQHQHQIYNNKMNLLWCDFVFFCPDTQQKRNVECSGMHAISKIMRVFVVFVIEAYVGYMMRSN